MRRKELLPTEIASLLLFSGRKIVLLKKLCRERLADDPVPGKTFAQRRVLSPGRVSQSIPLRWVSQPEGEVYSKVVMEILTYVLGVVNDGNVVLRELSSGADPREHPVVTISWISVPKVWLPINSEGRIQGAPHMRKVYLQ